MELDRHQAQLPSPPNPLSQYGRGGEDAPTPRLFQLGRGGENAPTPLPSPPNPLFQLGRGGENVPTPRLSQLGRGGENALTPLPPLSQGGRGAGGEGKGENKTDKWEIPPALRQKMKDVARQFRRESTTSEAILWQALRNRQLERRKFRRQQPIGCFVVDFFCAAEDLIVEVDGPVHESQQLLDRERQELLESLGLRFVRISSNLVETNLPAALDIIRQAFTLNSPHPPTPSPKAGEGNKPL